MCLRTLDILKSPVSQSEILPEHPQYRDKLFSLLSTPKSLVFSVCVVV
jgi:hypothetical protein